MATHTSNHDTIRISPNGNSRRGIISVEHKTTETTEITYREMADFLVNTYREISPWIDHTVTDAELGLLTLYYSSEAEERGGNVLPFHQLVIGYCKALRDNPELLCCRADMRDDFSLGCAQDVDVVMQYALFDGIIYG